MTNRLPTRSPRALPASLRAAAALVAVGALAACADAPTGAAAVQPPAGAVGAGAYRLTISGIGTDDQTATVEVDAGAAGASTGAAAAGLRASRAATTAFLAPGARGLTPRPNTVNVIQLQTPAIITGSFAVGASRTDPGAYRYVFAAFRVRNGGLVAGGSTTLTNLTLLAIGTSGSLGGTAISNLRRADGTAPANAATIAQGMAPAGASAPGRTGGMTALRTDMLQVFPEADVAASGIGTPYTPLAYGFSVLDTLTDGRSLATTASGTYPGLVLFAFKVPLQATAAEDVFTFSYNFFPVTDAETRVTESMEERDLTSSAAVGTRASNLGAVAIHAFRASPLTSNGLTRLFCGVRTAGTQASPTAFLGTSCASEITGMSLTSGNPVVIPAGFTHQMGVTLTTTGAPPTGIAYASANPAIATVSATGLVSGISAGTTTVYVGPHGRGDLLIPVTVTIQ